MNTDGNTSSVQLVSKPHIPSRIWGEFLFLKNPITIKKCNNPSIYTPTPVVYRILFQIHGSKLKPDPFAYLGQASEICKSHRVFFCACKHSLDRFFLFVIQRLHTIGVTYILWNMSGCSGLMEGKRDAS